MSNRSGLVEQDHELVGGPQLAVALDHAHDDVDELAVDEVGVVRRAVDERLHQVGDPFSDS